jgi:hypothetical protein
MSPSLCRFSTATCGQRRDRRPARTPRRPAMYGRDATQGQSLSACTQTRRFLAIVTSRPRLLNGQWYGSHRAAMAVCIRRRGRRPVDRRPPRGSRDLCKAIRELASGVTRGAQRMAARCPEPRRAETALDDPTKGQRGPGAYRRTRQSVCKPSGKSRGLGDEGSTVCYRRLTGSLDDGGSGGGDVSGFGGRPTDAGVDATALVGDDVPEDQRWAADTGACKDLCRSSSTGF